MFVCWRLWLASLGWWHPVQRELSSERFPRKAILAYFKPETLERSTQLGLSLLQGGQLSLDCFKGQGEACGSLCRLEALALGCQRFEKPVAVFSLFRERL